MNNMDGLVPINNCLLVELADDLEFVQTPDKQYATKTRGIVRAVEEGAKTDLINKKVFFEDFKDGTQVDLNGKKYAFIKYEEVRGYQQT